MDYDLKFMLNTIDDDNHASIGVEDEVIHSPYFSELPTHTSTAGATNSALDDPLQMLHVQSCNVLGKEFLCIQEAEEYYHKYLYLKEFNVQKDDLHCDKNGLTTVYRWVCFKEGFRENKYVERTNRVHQPRGQTREGCRAATRVNFDPQKMVRGVKEFFIEHSYNLTSSKHTWFLCSHRNVKESDMSILHSLKAVGVKPSQVMDQMVWTRPVVILSVNETVETYSWILKTFLLAMHENYPILVVTNGDKAMRKAIKPEMSGSIHRLCSWHLKRNVQTNFRDSGFTRSFTHCLNFMSLWGRWIDQWRDCNNKMKDDFEKLNEHPILVTHLLQLEKHASEVYTRGIFQLCNESTEHAPHTRYTFDESVDNECDAVSELEISSDGLLKISLANSSRQSFKTSTDCHFNGIVTEHSHITTLSIIDSALSNLNDGGQQKEKFLQSCFGHFMQMQRDMTFSGLKFGELPDTSQYVEAVDGIHGRYFNHRDDVKVEHVMGTVKCSQFSASEDALKL
ncbi:hypothetical protein JRO89_XS04G0070000 [Xanthoceras sorbifolium]|uniref:Protein FAR1-RELATED SEQUENCE n=1 Tax=Xanthoceras sorbifolium TaxID=99658 RepID=A0ABQ8I4G5_9ROSI|nr:hypothetical protein JRO89_XS04G0070000 [Xanthoceras sorbifolium]